MIKRAYRYTIEIILALGLFGALRLVVAATAVALVSVTVIAPMVQVQELTVSTNRLDMTGKTSDEVAITNRSSEWREIRFELLPNLPGSECSLHFSPTYSVIPPGGTQVVRFLRAKQAGDGCLVDHQLIVVDAKIPGSRLFEVALTSTDNSTAGQ